MSSLAFTAVLGRHDKGNSLQHYNADAYSIVFGYTAEAVLC
jgi:hypothetical protein